MPFIRVLYGGPIPNAFMALRETLRHSPHALVRGLGSAVTGVIIAGEVAAAELRSCMIDDKISNAQLAEGEENVTSNYAPPEPYLRRSADACLYERDGGGRAWVDGMGAYSAANVGNRNLRAMGAGIAGLVRTTVLARSRRSPELALAGKEVERFFGQDLMLLPMNTGCEAIEGAAVLAKLAFNRHPRFKEKREQLESEGKTPRAIYCRENFHGRSLWAKSASAEPAYKEPFKPLTMEAEMGLVDYGDVSALEEEFKKGDVYAFVVEPIQGEGGIKVPPPEYFQNVKALCDQHNVLLVMDEVQTGFGRTGTPLAQQQFGVKADITSFGKSASAGLWPVSGALAKKEYGELLKPGEHGSTFGGAPASMALMRAAMRELEDRDACRLSKENGTWFRDELIAMCTELPDVVEVRGMGLMIGIELKGEAGVVCERLRKSPFTYRGKKMEGFWTNDAHSKVIRISPPLIVDRDLLRASLYSFAQALGHPNPEQYRASDLEVPYSPSELMKGVADATKYYGGRARRFMEEVL